MEDSKRIGVSQEDNLKRLYTLWFQLQHSGKGTTMGEDTCFSGRSWWGGMIFRTMKPLLFYIYPNPTRGNKREISCK